ncbi:hypothetical protein PR003_g25473 [Phytophthora rubi]|uniref:Reverse transcriptase/retrotransposon-derived protein RNase H-like domain-containing protein n=1 Tax=Phytophthora rubi TaxID=129364 RepID=A0A6A3JIW4_9STRA|nr:hypothetical protein PR001_g21192 [Phytophthora rubi]KAE9289744.1 hypothetical protein PR003_g25473 [Phytophthora rubi]
MPHDRKQLRQWLGLATYLHHYSNNFLATIRLLSQFSRQASRGRGVLSTRHRRRGDDELAPRARLDATRLLETFHVVCDASDFAIDCAFMQFDDEGRERVVRYHSRQLKPA